MTNEQQFIPDWFSKPGDTLRAMMHRRCISINDLAGFFEGGLVVLRGLLDGSVAVDQAKAKTLAAKLGGTPDFWLKRQNNYEIALDRAVQIAADRESEEWLQRVPMPGGKPRGQISDRKLHEELRRRLVFFNVSSLKTWECRYGRLLGDTRFRTSPSFESNDDAVLLWLRRGELEADLISTRSWNPRNLEDRLKAIRQLSRISQPARFLPKLKEICAEAGVALVVVKAPHGCRASGASRLVTPNKAMILLSFRYRSDDQFWFTVFHEIGHLLLHGAKTFVDDDKTADDDTEQEANEFASSCIIPENRRSEFDRLADRDSVMRFSVSIGVAAGLTVGQMQHRQMIAPHQFNSLKRVWTWEDIDPALV
ncbi:ImmA/IrrE family metallo-endopeptidase [Mesorhizobium muleiense]|uniref:ImmA/IrrE family metallo-endopeptidase n=1 Tax=Mesorhizobium muleiense TaxID=1004279 RepID=UPI001F437E96|nr:ImmA/IrrE family metallo-endopeptidase [Mesorhizobium muleiense]MCF6113410.1 ImmA/IrrE family metallo-endopeptidase [Mesorhizobium muleiense]